MILFFCRGEADSDAFVKFCYGHYRDIMSARGAELPSSVEILREDGQKPRFDTDAAHFNLSHSHGVMMLGISHTPIGVDIELVRDIDIKKFPFIEAQDNEEFFEKWTERESYAKLIGEGIAAIRRDIPKEAHFEHFPVYGDFHACVCADEQDIIAYDIDINAVNG